MLKKFAFLPFLIFPCLLMAQFTKGTRMPGATTATLLFSSTNADVTFPGAGGYTSKNTYFNTSITPSMGWFISEHTAVGVTLNINPISSSTSLQSGGNTFQRDEYSAFNFGIGVFARNYFGKGSTFLPFGQVGVNAGLASEDNNGFFIANGNAYKTTYEGRSDGGFFTNANLSLGLTKMLNPHVGIDVYAGYNFSYTKNTLKTTTLRDENNNGSIDLTSVSEPTTKYTKHGLAVGVGLQIFLEKKSR